MANDDGPAGLSTSMIPAGLRPRSGKLPPHELADLLDRCLTRESRRLAVSPTAGLAGDRRHVELVNACAQRHPPRWTTFARRLADQDCHLRALDRAQPVDDS